MHGSYSILAWCQGIPARQPAPFLTVCKCCKYCCHTQSGQEMDQIRLCDIGRRNIGPTVRLVDRVMENSSEVGEKADYPVYQPCKKETDGVHVYSHWLSPLPFVLNSTSQHDYLSTRKKISVRPFLSSLPTPSPHFCSYLNISKLVST